MAARKTKTKSSDRPVIVTTLNRGVFYGHITRAASLAWEKQPEKATVALRASRLCVHWSADVKGFMGLATTGPTVNCRIGPAADICVRNVTAILEVSAVASAAWEAAPWRS